MKVSSLSKSVRALPAHKNESEWDKRSSAPSSSGPKSASWKFNDNASRAAAMERQDMQTKMSRRPPEVWLKDGEEKRLRFYTDEPVLIEVYNVKVNGKFRSITAPGPDEEDKFAEAGYRRSLHAVYEVCDINGYKSQKDGKTHRYVRRFYVVGARQERNLAALRAKRGGLSKYDLEISRSGSGTSTTYQAIPDAPSPMTPEMKKGDSLMKSFDEHYGPPSVEEQELLLKHCAPAD